jgi:hypothetical protein
MIEFKHMPNPSKDDPTYNIPKKYKDLIFVSKIEKDLNKLFDKFLIDDEESEKKLKPYL